MKTISYLCHLPILVWCCGCLHQQAEVNNPQTGNPTISTNQTPNQTNSAHHWKPEVFTVHDSTSGKKIKADGWSARVYDTKGMNAGRFFEKIHAFVVPHTQALWVGRPQDIYLIRQDAVIGIQLDIFGVTGSLRFYSSIFNQREHPNLTLDALKRLVEEKVDYEVAALFDSWLRLKPENGRIYFIGLVDLRDVFRQHLIPDFLELGSLGISLEDAGKVESCEIVEGILRVDMTTFRGREKGTVWVRIADRTLVRAVENGIQVYPK